MRLYLYVSLDQLEQINKLFKDSNTETDLIKVFTTQRQQRLVLVEFDYDTYINLIDQLKIEVIL